MHIAEPKFSAIPKFTTYPTYRINVSLDYVCDLINRWKRDYRLNLEPDFQRGHVWTTDQQVAYIEFLLAGGPGSKEIYFNHPTWGSGSSKEEFVLVDGLQRLTTVMKFMQNELSAFGYFFSDFTDDLSYTIELAFNVNKLKTRREVLRWYLEMNTGGVVHSQDELNRVKALMDAEK